MEEAHGDAGSSQQQGPLFKGLAADEKDVGVTEIESLCMECERNVSLLLLLFMRAVLHGKLRHV